MNQVGEEGVGKGGDIRITTDSLFLTNWAQIGTSTAGQGDAGNVIIHARDRVALDNGDIFSNVEASSANTATVGAGDNIEITTRSLLLTNGGQVAAITFAQENAGNVIIQARDRVSLDGMTSTNLPSSAIFSSVGNGTANTSVTGVGGDIRITTGSLVLTNGAGLIAETVGQGNAGDIVINARSHISLEGVNRQEIASLITSSTRAGAQGQGGNVRIAADSIWIADGAIVATSTQNSFSGGNVTLSSNTFEATGGAQVNTATSNQGQAGNITLNVVDRITLSGVTNRRPSSLQGNATDLYASTTSGSSGRSGIIQITTGQLEVSDQARVAVDSPRAVVWWATLT